MNVFLYFSASLINITPADAVIFKYDATNSEYVGQIHISNISNDKNVSFKVSNGFCSFVFLQRTLIILEFLD